MFFSCSKRLPVKSQDEKSKVKIIDIDSLKLTDFYVIRIDKGLLKDTCQIFSSKENLKITKGEKIELGKVYMLNLNLLKTTEKITGVRQRLYERDIYVNKIFVFPYNMLSYESSNLNGLYLK